jgi:hypothetical protein
MGVEEFLGRDLLDQSLGIDFTCVGMGRVNVASWVINARKWGMDDRQMDMDGWRMVR